MDAVARAANRLTGDRFTAEEVFGDTHDRTGEQIMVRLAGEVNCSRAALALVLAGKLVVGSATLSFRWAQTPLGGRPASYPPV
eukprot:226001-Alexandrium_andersonii.AAC.1